MLTPLAPADPQPASTSHPGSASPSGAGLPVPAAGAGAGSGIAPAPETTQPASVPAPPPVAAPDAVVTCPCDCSDAAITSEMVMVEPADRARVRMAVGERVRVTYSKGAAEWTQAGDGELSSTSGVTVTYTAPKVAGSVTLTATGSGCSATITFTIVAPTGVRMVKKFTSAARVQHTVNMPDVGMFTNIFLTPNDVNFHRVKWIELEINFSATGVYLCNRPGGNGHFPNANPLGMTTHVQDRVGTAAAAFDHIYSGHCGSAWAAPQTGTMLYPIPWRWRVGDAGAFHSLTTVNQRFNVDAVGVCTGTKAGSRVSVLASAPTSTP